MSGRLDEFPIFKEVGEAGINREDHGDGNEYMRSDKPSSGEPSGMLDFAEA
jgi:hypothetical protein